MRTMYRLFIDDERHPVIPDRWAIARTSEEAFHQVVSRGIPKEIAFDHDLGGDDTAIKFIASLTDYMLDMNLKFPKNFSYSVHSQNPVGVKNIHSKMESLLTHVGYD